MREKLMRVDVVTNTDSFINLRCHIKLSNLDFYHLYTLRSGDSAKCFIIPKKYLDFKKQKRLRCHFNLQNKQCKSRLFGELERVVVSRVYHE